MTFPNFIHDHDFKVLMQNMLCKNLNGRYTKFEEIAGHIWFKDFSFDDLISFNIEPPYIPKVEENEISNSSQHYKDYVKTLEDWEVTDDMPKITKKMEEEFKKWLEKF